MKFSNVDGDGDVDGDQSSQCSQCSQCYSCYSQLRKALNDKIAYVADEFQNECIPSKAAYVSIVNSVRAMLQSMHIPWIPMFYKPGWLLRYLVGPYDKKWGASIFRDVTSGLTVGLILIPQGLSYGILSGVPAINGLYASIVPAFCYVCFGSCMQLGFGPVSPVSLYTAQIVAHYQKHSISTPEGLEEVLDITAQICVCVGIILTFMGLMNMGYFINLISHPVMSAFTSSAAFSVGLLLLPSALGLQTGTSFRKAPKSGQPGYEYNYQVMEWWIDNWFEKVGDEDLYGGLDPSSPTYAASLAVQEEKAEYMLGWSRYNPFSQRIFLGVYIPLLVVNLLKRQLHSNRVLFKHSYWYKMFQAVIPSFPFLVIVIATSYTYRLVVSPADESTYLGFMQKNINIVGSVASSKGIHQLGRIPLLRYPFFTMFWEVVPLTFILFIESYSAAVRVATTTKQLHIVSSSQEMFAIGLANFLGALSSAFPVAGSFSRTSLYGSLGTRSLLALSVTVSVVMIGIGVFSRALYYIPTSALAAVLYASIYSTISFIDFWEAWKNSKKDFIIMVITFVFVFVYSTGYGLWVAVGSAVAVYLYDMRFDSNRAPTLYLSQRDNNGIDVVQVNSELVFLTSERVSVFVDALTKEGTRVPSEAASWQERMMHMYFSRVDPGVETLPKALVLDLVGCPYIDLTGAQWVVDLSIELKLKQVLFIVINANKVVGDKLTKIGFLNSTSTPACNIDIYVPFITNIGVPDAGTTGTIDGHIDSYNEDRVTLHRRASIRKPSTIPATIAIGIVEHGDSNSSSDSSSSSSSEWTRFRATRKKQTSGTTSTTADVGSSNIDNSSGSSLLKGRGVRGRGVRGRGVRGIRGDDKTASDGKSDDADATAAADDDDGDVDDRTGHYSQRRQSTIIDITNPLGRQRGP